MRLILFVDLELASSRMLLAGSLQTAAARDDIEIAAIFDTALRPPTKLPKPQALAGPTLRGALNVANAADRVFPMLSSTAAAIARRQKARALSTGDGTVNDPGFVEEVRRLQPDATLSLMVGQIFRPPLLAACNVAVNYHNGLLPRYQGVAATSWSIYQQAPLSGFTFHRMTPEVDRGPILLQDAVPLGPGATFAPVERAKSQLACLRLNRLFDMLASNIAETVQPDDPGSYFSRAQLQAIRRIEEPEGLSLGELERRLRAFGSIELNLAGQRWNTTGLRLAGSRARNRKLAFFTADGVWVEPSRVSYLPLMVYQPLRCGLSTARLAASRGRGLRARRRHGLTDDGAETHLPPLVHN